MSKKKDLSTGMSERTSDIILVAICAVVLAIVAYPLYYVLVASFSDPYEVYAGKTFLLPSGFTLDGDKAVFAEKNIVAGFLNSVKYTVIGTVFSVLLIAKCQQGYVGVSTWWYIEELMGDYAKDCVFLPPLTGPKGVFFTGQDDKGMWLSITEDEARSQYGKSAGELRNLYEVYGPKLILAEYYSGVFYMEDRAIERLTDLDEFWMPYVRDTTFYPVDCVFTGMEMETIDWHKTDFEQAVKEQEGLWLRDGGPTDEEWAEYKEYLSKKCGMDDLIQVYQDAYDRYSAAE